MCVCVKSGGPHRVSRNRRLDGTNRLNKQQRGLLCGAGSRGLGVRLHRPIEKCH